MGYSPWGHKESDTTEQTDRRVPQGWRRGGLEISLVRILSSVLTPCILCCYDIPPCGILSTSSRTSVSFQAPCHVTEPVEKDA